MLELLKRHQSKPILVSFNSVGDISLASWLAHRESVDLDLFLKEDFELQKTANDTK